MNHNENFNGSILNANLCLHSRDSMTEISAFLIKDLKFKQREWNKSCCGAASRNESCKMQESELVGSNIVLSSEKNIF